MKKIISFTLLIAIFTSCQTNEVESDYSKSLDIELIDNAKWAVNSEMKPFVERSEFVLNKYVSENKTNYIELSALLREQNSLLIQSCTMSGESHDQLHKWLHPHLGLVKKLKKADDEIAAGKVVDELKASFESYHYYFD